MQKFETNLTKGDNITLESLVKFCQEHEVMRICEIKPYWRITDKNKSYETVDIEALKKCIYYQCKIEPLGLRISYWGEK